MSDMEELKEKMAVAINESIWGKAMDSDPRSLLMAAAALRAIEKAGFAIVPREPTEAMLDDGQACLDCVPINRCEEQAAKVWRGMVASASPLNLEEPRG